MVAFIKYHAMGNDYLVINRDSVPCGLSLDDVRSMCDRRRGLGADGIVLGPGEATPGQRLDIEIFNSDGTACRRSGNAIRMFAHYIYGRWERTGATGGRSIVIHTAAGATLTSVRDYATGMVRANLGAPAFPAVPDRRPLLETCIIAGREVSLVRVNDGNPHAVVFLPDVGPDIAHELGEAIVSDSFFDERTNVEFAQVLSRDSIKVELWERGAGYTWASGSGACAAVAAAGVLGLASNKVTVAMPGGNAEVEVAQDGSVSLSGEVSMIAEGAFAPTFRSVLVPPGNAVMT